MTKVIASIVNTLIVLLTAILPKWKRLTVRARLHDKMLPQETVEISGGTHLKLYVPDRTCIYWVKDGPESEPATNAWIRSFSKDDTFLDVGANIGLYSLMAAANGVSRVYAIEPNPFSYAVLVRNIAANGLGERIVPLCVAMNEISSSVTFKLGGTHAGTIGNEIATNGGTDGDLTMTTASFSLDDLCRMQGFSGINHLKIDVDGLELEILRGATDLFANTTLKTVLVEDNADPNADTRSDLAVLMENFGFRQTNAWGEDVTSNRIYTRA